VSTKIFNAFKIRDRDRVWLVLEDIRERGERAVVDRLQQYYRSFVDNVDPEDEKYKAERARDTERIRDAYPEYATRLNIAQMALREGFRKSVTSMQRDFYDPDVSVALTWHATGFYLRAFCDNASLLGGSLDFLKTHPDLEDFHYQNQVDPPDDIEPEDFAARGRTWDEMSVPPGGGTLKNQLILEISSWSVFWRLDPWLDIYQEYHANPPTFPIREELFARRLRQLQAIVEVTASPCRLTGITDDGTALTIVKGRRVWTSRVGDHVEKHVSIEHATNWVEYLHLPDFLRRQVDDQCPGVIARNNLPKKRKI
jgi:hypothetical protein